MKLLARFHRHESPRAEQQIVSSAILSLGSQLRLSHAVEEKRCIVLNVFLFCSHCPMLMLFHPTPARGFWSDESGSKDGLGDLSRCPLVYVDIIFNTSRCQVVTSHWPYVILRLHHHTFPFLALAPFVSRRGNTRDSGQLSEHTDDVSIKSNQGLKSPVPASTCHTHWHPTSLSSITLRLLETL